MYALVTKGLNTFFFRFVCKEKYMEQDAVEYIYVLIMNSCKFSSICNINSKMQYVYNKQ